MRPHAVAIHLLPPLSTPFIYTTWTQVHGDRVAGGRGGLTTGGSGYCPRLAFTFGERQSPANWLRTHPPPGRVWATQGSSGARHAPAYLYTGAAGFNRQNGSPNSTTRTSGPPVDACWSTGRVSGTYSCQKLARPENKTDKTLPGSIQDRKGETRAQAHAVPMQSRVLRHFIPEGTM